MLNLDSISGHIKKSIFPWFLDQHEYGRAWHPKGIHESTNPVDREDRYPVVMNRVVITTRYYTVSLESKLRIRILLHAHLNSFLFVHPTAFCSWRELAWIPQDSWARSKKHADHFYWNPTKNWKWNSGVTDFPNIPFSRVNFSRSTIVFLVHSQV